MAPYYSNTGLTSGDTWHRWNYENTATSTDTWNYWNNTTDTCESIDGPTSPTADPTWNRWVDGEYVSGTSGSVPVDPYGTAWLVWNNKYERYEFLKFVAKKKTEKELEKERTLERINLRRTKRKRLAFERTRSNREIFYRLEREIAENKAKTLLLDLIGEKELVIFEETKRLLIKGRKYDYIIPLNGHIKRIEKDKVTDLCIHLKQRNKFPERDNVIGLKLLLESNEEEFNKIANVHQSVPANRFKMPRCARG